MNNTDQELYQAIKDGRISREDAIKQIKENKDNKNISTEQDGTTDLRSYTSHFLAKVLSEVLTLPLEKIKYDAPLEDYGIDSVKALRYTNALEEHFGELSKTLLFEYQCLSDLTGYIIEQHAATIQSIYKTKNGNSRNLDETLKPDSSTTQDIVTKESSSPQKLVPADGRNRAGQDIAVIGIAGQYPQASNTEEFWNNLLEGKDCITEVPENHWDIKAYFDSEAGKTGKSYSKWGGFLKNPYAFDPLFFNVSPKEAKWTDPQERLFLQTVYETIEDAGYTKQTLAKPMLDGLAPNIGVYVGVMYTEYQMYGVQEQALGRPMVMQGSPSSIANRASYYFNFNGPSMAVDTMCSSSLTAIHLAYQSLVNGDCDYAIAGGVNLSLHPNKYLALSVGRFVSPTGRCHSFGENGDGYVPGEGVGAVLLKPLEQAIQDGDNIQGVIKATDINHGGKTNGYTVPNPKAQTSVVERAFKKSSIPPRNISYIEAHGTGTSLGDPIEIKGLSSAFEKTTSDKNFCSIGSVKSNVGHCESAAGMAGLTKVLLQMKYETLVPSIHTERLNPHIKFDTSPFKVQRSLSKWHAPTIDGEPQPRIAGISAFGAGGSNAHLIVEEYKQPIEQSAPISTPFILVLSATKPERLKEYAKRLLGFLQKKQTDTSSSHLKNICYTYQTGRESFKTRIGISVTSHEATIQCLQDYINDNTNDSLYIGGNTDSVNRCRALNDLPHRSLANWLEGDAADWQSMYPNGLPRRVSAPGYPFNLKEYRMPQSLPGHANRENTKNSQSEIITHTEKPTITKEDIQMESNLNTRIPPNFVSKANDGYQATFSGSEFFLVDHHIQNTPILPGVMYMELVTKALQSESIEKTPKNVIHFNHIVWIQPFIGSGKKTADIVLTKKGNDLFSFDIKPDRNKDSVYSQGHASIKAEHSPENIDLHKIKSQCNNGHANKEECYHVFDNMGIKYGPSHRPIERIQWGQDIALAHLKLPPDIKETIHDFNLHPSLMDGAMQSNIGLSLGKDPSDQNESFAPFAIEEVKFYQPLPEEVWVWVRRSEGSKKGDLVQKNDLDICDKDGNICVQLHRVTSRRIDLPKKPKKESGHTISSPTPRATSNKEKSLEIPVAQAHFNELETVAKMILWSSLNEIGLSDSPGTIKTISSDLGIEKKYEQWLEESLRILIDSNLVTQDGSEFQPNPDKNLPLDISWKIWNTKKPAWKEDPQTAAQVDLVEACLNSLTDIITGKVQATDVMFPNSSMDLVENIYKNNLVADFCNASLAKYLAHHIRHKISENPSKKIRILEVGAGTGGTSSLVFKALQPFEKNIADYRYTDLSKAFLLHAEENYGPNVPYLSYGIFNAESHPSIQNIKQEFDIVIGANVLHATRNMTETLDNIKSTLIPGGVIAINEITHKKAFAHLTFGLLDGWWRFDDPETRIPGTAALSISHWENLLTKLGYANLDRPISDAEHLGQQIIVATSDGNIKPHSSTSPHDTKTELLTNTQGNYSGSGDRLLQKTIEALTADLCTALNMAPEKVDPEGPFELYGVDSIMASRVANKMQERIPSVTATKIYEYGNIAKLAEHLVSTDRDLLTDAFGIDISEQKDKPKEINYAAEHITNEKYTPEVHQTRSLDSEDIAIIGISGKYPGADSIEEFWANLSQGISSVSEIPNTRWDWTKNYSEDRTSGKVYTKFGAFIKNIARFDAEFFGISAPEAAWMDPQERLLLETAYSCIEDAGYTPETLDPKNKVGVFVGVTNGFYSSGPQYFSMPNRISYNFDFKGPSFAIDSACSSSLTGVHLAVESLRSGTSNCALVGGVNLLLSPKQYEELCFTGMLTHDDKCKSFSDHADGFVDGEGVGALLLKPLSQAKLDGDNIHGIIKATMINSSGRTNRYATPKAAEQTEVITEAIKQAKIDPRTINYIEAHATGTPMGDSIELMGLNNALQQFSDDKQYCAIGSYKPNIGYCESASGIAGITKVLLQMRYRKIAPSIHCDELNSEFSFEDSPLYVQQQLSDWESVSLPEHDTNIEQPRRAGVSSFGATGSNAHVILEEYLPNKTISENSPIGEELVLISAKTLEGLQAQVNNLRDALTSNTGVSLNHLAYTLRAGREQHAFRIALISKDTATLVGQLSDYLSGNTPSIEGVFLNDKQGSDSMLQRLSKESGFNDIVSEWMEKRNFSDIATLWVNGTDVSWSLITPPKNAHRISLPTYPFSGRNHWMSSDGSIQTEDTTSNQLQHAL